MIGTHEADIAEVVAVSVEREPNGGGSAAGLSPPRWARNENATTPTPEGGGSCGYAFRLESHLEVGALPEVRVGENVANLAVDGIVAFWYNTFD